ncbi:Fur family transcriptional regulator [Miniphocaeibacter massiliensis]|uniref:Fur family transcriptional regulator n=1 Tax=Miniphocaeibacter massiliensis TaxID=2041841 RepID=UPI000C1B8872|nr:Fur family transcriptional regulator [Miniphocaeibacter massiliensis]
MEKLLQDNNLKITKIRIAILEELLKLNVSITAEELFEIISKLQNVNLSTIYRNLKILVENNLILKVTEINGETYYRYNKQEHIHHLICTNCHEVLPLEDCPIHDLEHKLELKTGYNIVSHSLEFRGLCPKCKEKTRLK